MCESGNAPFVFEPALLEALFAPALRTTAALTRLDERLRKSPIREGYLARIEFHEAVASMWLGGELVHLEDLVLHDAYMDIRAPTHELTLAHQVLRATRQVTASPPEWALSSSGLQSLRGLKPVSNSSELASGVVPSTQRGTNSVLQATFAEINGDTADDVLVDHGDTPATIELNRQLTEMDTKLKRLNRVLDGNGGQGRAAAGKITISFAADVGGNSVGGVATSDDGRNPLIYDEDDNAEARLTNWQTRLKATQQLPSILRAAIALDSWNQDEILPRSPWLGPLLAASMLRGENKLSGKASGLAHLPALRMGLRVIPRERRNAKDQTIRLTALIEAFEQSALIGLKEHDRLILAREQMLRKLKGKRTNSKLPQLIELVLSGPLVTSTMIERELKVTLQGALNLIAELGLREVTGRGRYRAWAVA